MSTSDPAEHRTYRLQIIINQDQGLQKEGYEIKSRVSVRDRWRWSLVQSCWNTEDGVLTIKDDTDADSIVMVGFEHIDGNTSQNVFGLKSFTLFFHTGNYNSLTKPGLVFCNLKLEPDTFSRCGLEPTFVSRLGIMHELFVSAAENKVFQRRVIEVNIDSPRRR